MGMFQVRVRVSNPTDPSRFFEEDFWVDTGALYTFAPEDRLASIGLTPRHSRDVVLADGSRERRPLGEAPVTIPRLGETLTCPIVFAPPGSLYLLGATALETFGVDADPVARDLRPILAVVGGFLGSREPPGGGRPEAHPRRPELQLPINFPSPLPIFSGAVV